MKKNLLLLLSKAISTYLTLDPESHQRLHNLAGKSIAIELKPFNFTFYCLFTSQGISLQNVGDKPEAILRGTPLQLAGAMLSKQNRQRFFADDLIIEGNADIGLQVVELFDSLQIDWEELLAQVISDTPAYHISRFLKGTGNWFKRTESSFRENISEYIHEESRWLPSREALQDFFNDIDNIRMDIDRAEARIAQLKNQIEGEATRENH